MKVPIPPPHNNDGFRHDPSGRKYFFLYRKIVEHRNRGESELSFSGDTALRDIGQERSGSARPLRRIVHSGAGHPVTGFPVENAFVPDLDNMRQRTLRRNIQHQPGTVEKPSGRAQVCVWFLRNF